MVMATSPNKATADSDETLKTYDEPGKTHCCINYYQKTTVFNNRFIQSSGILEH